MRTKQFLSLLILLLFFGNANAQSELDNEITKDNNLELADNHFPMFNENIFGYDKKIIYSLTWIPDNGIKDRFYHFINAGITNNFSISIGTVANDLLDIRENNFYFLNPEYKVPLFDNLILSFSRYRKELTVVV